jgi:Peptidase inhibitor family I36
MTRLRALAAVIGAIGALLVLPAGASASGNTGAAPATATTGAVPQATIHGCPAGFYCFYDDINFNAGTSGRRLQFQSCGVQNLTNFGFNDDASAWVNNTGHTVDVFKDIGARGGLLWHSPAHSQAAFVGGANNDQASSFRINC